ncbi:MAG TPA: ATP-binding protein [Bryobacteraceae bacterium]|jgi:PAS domain S-box-containing protein|nr:ATP-binding protein [Bryobacteraceae bacterium]
MAATTLDGFRALIENSSDAIFLVNAKTEIMYASPSTAKVLGYQPEELVGRNGLELIHPQDREQSTQALKEVIAKPQSPLQIHTRVRRKDGEWCWVESTASNLLNEPHVQAIVLNAREISARRAAEEERQRHSEELARSNAELQSFAQNVAHDLKEPLRTISAFTQLLLRKAPLDPINRQFADFIVDGVSRMTTLLEELLASATYGFKGALERVEMGIAARQAMQNLTEAIASNAAIITIGTLPAVQANECDVIRLFQNLISNAVKYRSATPVEIRITAERSELDWIIKVRDNGIGISKEHQQRVFGLFTRLHTLDVPGAGIGLAVCKKIVEERGGTIWVESEPGAGSTFCFSWHSD